MSEVLDDDRKEAFLLALHSLKEEKEDADAREEKLRQQQREQLEQRRRDEKQRLEQRAEEARRRATSPPNPRPPQTTRPPSTRPPPSPAHRRAPAKKPAAPPPTLSTRLAALLAALHRSLADGARHLTHSPLALLQTLLFLVAFALALGRRDLRERALRVLRGAGEKVRRTLGMGVKVSYI